jgi:hypothetical protein
MCHKAAKTADVINIAEVRGEPNTGDTEKGVLQSISSNEKWI